MSKKYFTENIIGNKQNKKIIKKKHEMGNTAIGYDLQYKPYEALHRLDYTSDTKESISQGHCSNKLNIKLSFVYYIILSQSRNFTKKLY